MNENHQKRIRWKERDASDPSTSHWRISFENPFDARLVFMLLIAKDIETLKHYLNSLLDEN